MERMEIRSNATLAINDETLFVEGLVNKTDSWSNVLGNRKKFREKISKGAFARALNEARTIDFLYDHNRNLILSTTDNGSLTLWEDEEGLQMRAEVSKTSYGSDAYVLIKDRIISHMSFGFKAVKERWTKGIDGIYERIIDELVLTEVSAVRNPAYSQSAIEARGIEVIEDVEIPNLEEKEVEERGSEIDIEALKASLKSELLAELHNAKIEDEVKSVETETVSNDNQDTKIEENVNNNKKDTEEKVETVVEEKNIEETKVEDSSNKTETKVETNTVENYKKFDATDYLNAIKENQKKRL